MLFLFTWEVPVYWRASKKIGPQKLLRLQDVATFRSDHPRNKSGIQLRSQIVWTFHFWSPFNDPRHPLAVRLQCLKILSGKKKQHIKSGLKNNKTISPNRRAAQLFIYGALSRIEERQDNAQLRFHSDRLALVLGTGAAPTLLSDVERSIRSPF